MEKRLKIFNFKILTSWVLYREMMVWCVYNEKKKTIANNIQTSQHYIYTNVYGKTTTLESPLSPI